MTSSWQNRLREKTNSMPFFVGRCAFLTRSSLLLQSMSPEQAERFDVFKRSGLNKAAIKRVAAQSDHQMSNGVTQLVAGVGKIFVGEIMAKGGVSTLLHCHF